jgi:GNAT superfamily N-acetyltransferase
MLLAMIASVSTWNSSMARRPTLIGLSAGRAPTERSWANCLCFGIYGSDGTQVGCAGLLTDYAFRAHLGDVVTRPASRGLGLGKALVETILAQPELATVSLWTLTTADAHGLYARHGFRPGEANKNWMATDREVANN